MEFRIAHILDETDTVKSFILDGNVDFVPGQYMLVDLPGIGKRPFSISTSPTEGVLAFTVDFNDPITKTAALSLSVGDSVEIDGPFGNFTLDESAPKEVIMLAGGMGIAPMRSMIKYAIDTDFPPAMKLIHSIKTGNDIIFEDDMDRWSEETDKIWYIPTLTQSEPTDWYGELGRISKEILERHTDRDSIFYVSGSPGFVTHVVSVLNEMGISGTMIRTDSTGYDA